MKLSKPWWRINHRAKKSGSLSPEISLFPEEFLTRNSNNRFLLACSDYNYLLENIESLDTYEKSNSPLTLLCGIYFDYQDLPNAKSKLELLKEKSYNKINFFAFYSKDLSSITSTINSVDISWDYIVNYIRISRFNLVMKIWDQLGISKLSSTICTHATYIVDLDFFALGNFDLRISNEYAKKRMIFSWSNNIYSNTDFPKKLSGLSLKCSSTESARLVHYPSHRTIKAGFTCLSPSKLSRLFLDLFKSLSIGSQSFEREPIYMRLCTFYYGDQLAILLSLQDLKGFLAEEYDKEIGWIDIYNSSIVNLSLDSSPLLYLPKGNGIYDGRIS